MKKVYSFILLVGLTIVVVYCDNGYFGRFLTRAGTNNPESVTQECNNNGDCEITNTYAPQPASAGTTPVAVVIVGDTSASMGNNFEATADALTSWLTHFQDIGLENFCFAFMPGHAGTKSGRYFSPDADHPACMCSTDYSVEEIADKMGYTLRHYPTSDTMADGTSALTQGGEVTLYSSHFSVTDADAMADNLAAGCFPPEYAVAWVYLNDENDASSAVNGTQIANCDGKIYEGPEDAFDGLDLGTVVFDNAQFPAAVSNGGAFNTTNINSPYYNHPDGQCKEVQARLRWYSNPDPMEDGDPEYELAITPQSVADDLIAFNGILPSFASAVGTVPTDFVADGQAGPYWGAIEIADIFDQEIANIKYAGTDQDAFNEELDTLAEAMALTVSFIFGFDLVDEDGNPAVVCADEIDNMVVTINGDVVDPDDYTLNAARNRVNFDPGFDFDFSDVVEVQFNTCDE